MSGEDLRRLAEEAAAKVAAPCSGCGDTGWCEDENWWSEYGEERQEAAGLIPCGFCNGGNWDDYRDEFTPDKTWEGRLSWQVSKFTDACSPTALLTLLDALDTANAEVARLTAALEAAEQRWTTSVWERLQTALSELEVTVLGGGEDAAGTDAEVREVAERVVEAFLAWWDASPTPGPQTGSEVMTEKDRIRSEVAKLRAEVEAAKAAPGPPVCEVCDLTEDYAHHVAQGTKGYHPFAPRTEGGA